MHWTAVIVALLDLWVGARYCVKLIRREIRPRIATWLIFEIGVGMSLAAYFTSRHHSVIRAALNLTDTATVTVILVALLIRQRGQTLQFTRNEQLCLAISAVTLAAWATTKTAWVALAGFQAVMSLAYVPTIEHVWQWKPGRPPEPGETWAINAVAALLGVLINVSGADRDFLAMIYPLRAFVLCMTVVLLVERWKYLDRKAGPGSDPSPLCCSDGPKTS